jgi:hypothetical protein
MLLGPPKLTIKVIMQDTAPPDLSMMLACASKLSTLNLSAQLTTSLSTLLTRFTKTTGARTALALRELSEWAVVHQSGKSLAAPPPWNMIFT